MDFSVCIRIFLAVAWRWSKGLDIGGMTQEREMELRKFFGQSGKVYFVTWSEETHWHAFMETANGLVSVVAGTAALDCGAVDDPKGSVFGSKELNTHRLWQQIWKNR
jgi:hypothetical protein